jgi:hypothetical protein
VCVIPGDCSGRILDEEIVVAAFGGLVDEVVEFERGAHLLCVFGVGVVDGDLDADGDDAVDAGLVDVGRVEVGFSRPGADDCDDFFVNGFVVGDFGGV